MSSEEEGVLTLLANDVEKLMPLKALVVGLLVGAFSMGVWVATLQFRTTNTESRMSSVEARMSAIERSSNRTDRNVVRLGIKLGVDVETPKD